MVVYKELPLGETLTKQLGDLKIDFAFQPIFKKSTMEMVGQEALMRPVGATPLELIQEYSLKGGLHTLELASFF